MAKELRKGWKSNAGKGKYGPLGDAIPAEELKLEDIKKKADEAEALEKGVQSLIKYQGYHKLELDGTLQHAREDHALFDSDGLPTNDYIAAVLLGPAEAAQGTLNNLMNSAIVGGLLLTVSLSYAVGPPDAIKELADDHASKSAFIVLMVVSAGFSFIIIVFAAQFAVAVSRSVREADKMRVLLHIDNLIKLDPNSISVVSMYGTVLPLVAGILVATAEAYSKTTMIVCFAVFLVLVAVGAKLGAGFVSAGHISIYWKAAHLKGDPVDLELLTQLIKKKVEIGKALFGDWKFRNEKYIDNMKPDLLTSLKEKMK